MSAPLICVRPFDFAEGTAAVSPSGRPKAPPRMASALGCCMTSGRVALALAAHPAGMVAATLSHPLDTVKTCALAQLQTSQGESRRKGVVARGARGAAGGR